VYELKCYWGEDIAAAIVAVLVAAGKRDSSDLRALAAIVHVPWAIVERAVRAQAGQGEDVLEMAR